MNMKIAWLTDTHLDSGDTDSVERIADQIRAQKPDALLLTGDIGVAETFSRWVLWLGDAAPSKPIYFVLGNHDLYEGWAANARLSAKSLTEGKPHARYLTAETQPVILSPEVCLIGHDGWADGRLGSYLSSHTKDAKKIYEFGHKSERERGELAAKWADESAAHLRKMLAALPEGCRRVIVATHVPPFVGNHPTDNLWLAHMVSASAGEALREFADANPAVTVEVCCGHTHRADVFAAAPNLTMYVGHPALAAKSPIGVIKV
jgi:Icc protein